MPAAPADPSTLCKARTSCAPARVASPRLFLGALGHEPWRRAHTLRRLLLMLVVTSCTPSAPVEVSSRSDALEADGRWQARQRTMMELIATDPQRALEVAMTPPQRAALPLDVQPFVERWVDGVGDLDVV